MYNSETFIFYFYIFIKNINGTFFDQRELSEV